MEKTKGILTIFFKDAPSEEVDATLEMDDKNLRLIFNFEFKEEWYGRNIGPDIFQVECDETGGTGHLIYLKELKTLHGHWKEPGGEGMLLFQTKELAPLHFENKNSDKNLSNFKL